MALLMEDRLMTMNARALGITRSGLSAGAQYLAGAKYLHVFRYLSTRQPAPAAVLLCVLKRPFMPSGEKGCHESIGRPTNSVN